MVPFLFLLCGVTGGAGVATFAASAHAAGSDAAGGLALSNAAIMMMVHAAAGLAIVAVSSGSRVSGAWHAVASAMVGGALLFGAAVALPKLAGFDLFPLAAPIGGSIAIASWLLLAITGVVLGLRSRGARG